MATKNKYTGVSQWKNGWEYRIKKKTEDGKVIDTKIKYDENGKPFKKAVDASKARESHLLRLSQKAEEKPVEASETPSVTLLKDVYENYLLTKSDTRAYNTLSKQDTMWRQHISPVFGERDINTILVIELESFLNRKYKEYSYEYVKDFYKFFYLLFSHSYRMGVYDNERYKRNFTRLLGDNYLKLPDIKQTDKEKEGIEVYDDYTLYKIEKYLKDTDSHCLLPFYLGLFCGLRKSEVFGLRWSNVDFDNRTIKVNRQLMKIGDEWHLTEVKTLKSLRTVLITDKLLEELMFVQDMQISNKKKLGTKYHDTELVYDEVDKKWIRGADFVCRKPSGYLMTKNCIKYLVVQLKQEFDIDFRFHVLRHTFGTKAAYNNMPNSVLMQLMGHTNIETTQKYYIGVDENELKKMNLQLITQMYKGMENPFHFTIKENDMD